MKMTLGPAGPPLHKGVLEVPQSKQVLFWPSSDEPSFGFLRFMSSDSDPCTNTQNRSDQQLFRSKPHDWDQERKAPNLITELIVWIQHFCATILKIQDRPRWEKWVNQTGPPPIWSIWFYCNRKRRNSEKNPSCVFPENRAIKSIREK